MSQPTTMTEETAFNLWHGVPITIATEEQIDIHRLLFDDNILETRDEVARLREENAILKDEVKRMHSMAETTREAFDEIYDMMNNLVKVTTDLVK